MLSRYPPFWRLSEKELREHSRVIDALGALVHPVGLSAFALAIRSSLLLFGTGATFYNPMERLAYTLSSLEALLLRHSAEPAELSVPDRVGVLLAEGINEREEIARKVREAYRLRSRQEISPLTPRENVSTAAFIGHAHQVIDISLANVGKFDAVTNFVTAIESQRVRVTKS